MYEAEFGTMAAKVGVWSSQVGTSCSWIRVFMQLQRWSHVGSHLGGDHLSISEGEMRWDDAVGRRNMKGRAGRFGD